MTETTELAAATKRRGLTAMRLAELQDLAAGMGIGATAKMRKGDLITAIKSAQGAAPSTPRTASQSATHAAPPDPPAVSSPATTSAEPADGHAPRSPGAESSPRSFLSAPSPDAARDQGRGESPARTEGAAAREQGTADRDRQGDAREQRATREQRTPDRDHDHDNGREQRTRRPDRDNGREQRVDRADSGSGRDQGDRQDRQGRQGGDGRENGRDQRDEGRGSRDARGERDNGRVGGGREHQQREQGERSGQQGDREQSQDGRRGQRDQHREDDERGGRRRNRQRNRDRKRRGGRGGDDYQPQNDQPESLGDDDVIVPVAGILDVLDNYAFVRTSGYLPGPNDVYVPLNFVKKHALRKGDAVTGAVRALREGEQLPPRQKFNALVRLDTINGTPAEQTDSRVEFGKLTPLYPQQRLRLETEPNVLTTRIIDLVSPIGKGQRGLIVAPAKAGKTMVMQALANAITKNNPECHLMVVLVDERPEEVTDMQRAVKGEVISSTFDRPATDHTTVAELAIERAKRLVELGHDVVVLLDSITKLGRAYNLAAPASGRILSGGVDSAALYPPKRFFGAARNIEHGGSLTILATALVETGSKMDEVIFEEFKGTGNMELKLDRGLANRRIFPAVDINASSTRREEILLAGDELKIMWKLRRVLAALDQQQGIELLIDRLKKTKSNVEFLMQVQSNSPLRGDDDD